MSVNNSSTANCSPSRLPELFERIVAELDGRGEGDIRSCRCPAHDDQRASLSATLANDKILLFCHRGCSFKAIRSNLASRLGEEAVFLSDRQPIAYYDYESFGGGLLFQVVRYQPKGFSVRRPDGNGGWVKNLKGVTRVPFRLPELLGARDDEPVFICEGEKDALALVELGLIATTNSAAPRKTPPTVFPAKANG